MHPLKRWRKDNGLTLDDAAALFGVRRLAVYRWEAGSRFPEKDNIEAVFTATRGAVEPNDWFDLDTLRAALPAAPAERAAA